MRMWIVKRSTLIRWAIILALVTVLIVICVVACSGDEGSIDSVENYEVETLASATKERPIYSVGIEDKRAALSFDAEGEAGMTEKVMEILEANNVRATFFLCGFWIDKYPEYVKAIKAAGHEIGNHTESHPHMPKIAEEKMLDELRIVDEKLTAITGVQYPLFRAPYGEYDDKVIRIAHEAGYVPIQWSIDSMDWKKGRSPDKIVGDIMKKLAPGSIILCHVDGANVEQYLPNLIEQIKSKGYTLVPVSEMLHTGVTRIDSKGVQWPATVED